MNERIRELAAQAGYAPLKPRTFADDLQDIFLQKFAALVAAAERESIAQMFDGKVWAYDYREIAAAIRARRGKE